MLFDELTHGLETIYHVAMETGGTYFLYFQNLCGRSI